MGKLRLVRTKYLQLCQEEDQFYEQLKARVNHLAETQSEEAGPGLIRKYFETRLDRIVLDYMLRMGYFQTAKLYAAANKITVSFDILTLQQYSDLPVFKELKEISN